MVSQPMVQQAPVATPPVVALPDEPTPARPAAERRAARTVAAPAAAVAATPRATAPTVSEVSPQTASVPLTQPVVTPPPVEAVAPPQEGAQVSAIDTPPAQAVAADDGSVDPLTAAGGLLLALGLGAGAYMAVRGRRRRHVDTQDEAYAVVPAHVPVAVPVPPAPVMGTPVYAAAAPQPDVARRIGEEELVPATHAAASQAPVARQEAVVLRDGPVPNTREGRDALLEQMIAAEPDAENPFTSRKGRLRRARIILQSREITQKDEAASTFDWRTYKSPTSNPAPATPPRVTA